MISIQINRIANAAIVARARQQVITYANRNFRAQVYKMFEDALMVSAQFSGDYVSNWRIVADSADLPQYERWPEKGAMQQGQRFRRPDGTYGMEYPNAHKAGDPEAVTYAREQAARAPFSYKQKVYFVNPTPLEFTATEVTGEGGTQKLRPENIIPGSVRLSSYLRAKYGV